MSFTVDRRRLLAGAAASASTTAFAMPEGEVDDLAAAMRDPPIASRPQIRWWWPGGAVDPTAIRREAQAIAAAGFGGFEIADVRDSITVPIDPKTKGWGSPAWRAAVDAALEEAVRAGVTPSLTLGPHWPTGVPGVHPDDDAASKELVHGVASLAGGASFSGPVPPPVQARPSGVLPVANEHPPVTPMLIAVQAMRVIAAPEGGPPLLDPASLVDLTPLAKDGQLSWRAPAGGDWLLLGFWMRGTGQIQNMFGMNRTASMLADPIPYVLDIYGPAAVAALTRYWDEHLLSPRTRDLIRRAGGVFFEDSLELSAACPWTPTAIERFGMRCGYPLAPYFALLVSRAPTMNESILGGGRPLLFRLDGIDEMRVRHDFDATLSAMYVDNRVRGVSRWAAGHGARFRVQAIGSDIDSGLAAAIADIPEGDNSNDIHGWRHLAAGRDIGGHTILSDEAGTFVKGSAHVATWRDLFYMLQRDMAGGANQMMLHGFSHADAPGAAWPGFSAFGRAIGNDWGPRDPMWTMAPAATAYIGRLQHLLRQGRTEADLAVLGAPLRSQAVLHAGYTFQYPAMELFTLPQMTLRGGRLMPDGPAYRAVVLNAVAAIDPAVARRLLDHARAGLPIVIVGEAPSRARGWKDAAAADADVAAAMRALMALSAVRRVGTQGEVPAALASLGIAGTIAFPAPARVLALKRRTPTSEIVYLLNDGDERVAQTVGFTASGDAYQVDLWSGELVRLPRRRGAGDTLLVDLALAAGEPAVLVFSRAPLAGAIERAPLRGHPRPLAAGGGWDVTFEDWRPGAKPDETVRRADRLRLDRLVPWSELPGRAGMAGVARYAMRVTAGASRGAEIDLGAVSGAASIAVNGAAPQMVNPFTGRVRIDRWLRPGSNAIEVTVASPLNNRLLADHIGEQGFKPPVEAPPRPAGPDLADGPAGLAGMQPGAAPPAGQRTVRPYGLIGPVMIKL